MRKGRVKFQARRRCSGVTLVHVERGVPSLLPKGQGCLGSLPIARPCPRGRRAGVASFVEHSMWGRAEGPKQEGEEGAAAEAQEGEEGEKEEKEPRGSDSRNYQELIRLS